MHLRLHGVFYWILLINISLSVRHYSTDSLHLTRFRIKRHMSSSSSSSFTRSETHVSGADRTQSQIKCSSCVGACRLLPVETFLHTWNEGLGNKLQPVCVIPEGSVDLLHVIHLILDMNPVGKSVKLQGQMFRIYNLVWRHCSDYYSEASVRSIWNCLFLSVKKNPAPWSQWGLICWFWIDVGVFLWDQRHVWSSIICLIALLICRIHSSLSD